MQKQNNPNKWVVEALKIFRGISARGHVTFIHLNTDTQTWTASIIKPNDPKSMCLVDAGFTGEIIDNKESIKAFKW